MATAATLPPRAATRLNEGREDESVAVTMSLPVPRTITELLQIRAQHFPDQSILGYPSRDLEYTEYSFSTLDRLATAAARLYATRLPVRHSSDKDTRVVGLLAVSNLDYIITTLALTRLGFTVLFLSTRISEAAYLSLLDATSCQHLIVDGSFQKTARSLQASYSDLNVHQISSQDEYSGQALPNVELPDLDYDQETAKIAWIIHSSGSTGLPKPIRQTHAAALRNYEQNMDMRGFITLPFFHAHGLSSVFRAVTSRKKIYVHNASLPLTSHNLLNVMTQHDFEIFYGVPYALKLLSETSEGIAALARMKIVMFGGSACPDALGNLLVENGVNLVSHYGTTETGQLMTSFRPAGDKSWNYVRVHDKLAPYIRWEDRGANLYELCVLPGWPSKVATNRDDGSYATKDLFEPHASIAGAWKYTTRLDDTIVLMNGEKVIPIAMEQAVRHNSFVREAVMFGAGKSQLGMMVVASDSAKNMDSADLMEKLWPVVEAENRQLPAYGQLSKDMVRILPSDTPFAQTDKGTVIRQAFYKAFAEQIEDLYRQLEERSAGTKNLNLAELRDFIRQELLTICPQEDDIALDENVDLFSLGVDSLQSAKLRSRVMQEVALNGKLLPQNVVFEYPTIGKLASAIMHIKAGEAQLEKNVIKEMESLVEKYTQFPEHKPTTKINTNICVIVTGATGSLGAHIVAQLVSIPDVGEVCCLVRATSDVQAYSRTRASMRERAVWDDLPSAARDKISAYKSDFSKSDLGLEAATYAKLTQTVFALIHCAWSVNFNKSLSSFEADCIAGSRNLMLLCLSAQSPKPASFNFCSSVSTVASTPGTNVPEDLPGSSECAHSMGYAQSKLVTENIVAGAASRTSVPARVLRIGQIIADTRHGIWNDTEAIPLMLQSATTIGALPALDESPRWLPVDVVAKACIDISLSSTEHTFFNIVSPRTFHWTKDLLPALHESSLDFREVGQREWVDLLRKSDPNVDTNPTFKLLDFFTSKYDNDVTKRKNLDYETSRAEAVAPILSEVGAMDAVLVQKFIKQFLATSWSGKE